MKVTADTNLLVRFLLGDDPQQSRAAEKALKDADLVAIPIVCLCELVWVLRRVYRFKGPDIADALRALVEMETVAVDRPAVEAGLSIFEAGADFADGVIAYEGRWLGGEVFVSFDRRAVSLLSERGQEARLLT
jgi:predicted nucleic-acid-binding protein